MSEVERYRSEILRLQKAGIVFQPQLSSVGLCIILSALQIARRASDISPAGRGNFEVLGRSLLCGLADHSQELAAIIDKGWLDDSLIFGVNLKK